jgi:hypothetical protein
MDKKCRRLDILSHVFGSQVAVHHYSVLLQIKKLKYFFVQRRGRITIEYHKKDIWFIALIGREKGLR